MTLDQLRLFYLIVKKGGFSAAAREVKRAPSAVSMGIKNLEDYWGLKLFDRTSYRPTLTVAGRAIFAEVKGVLEGVAKVERHVQSLTQGLEPLVEISINNLFPVQRIEAVLRDVQEQFPDTLVNINVDHMDTPMKKLLAGDIDIAITMANPSHETRLKKKRVMNMELIAVGAKSAIPSTISREQLRQLTQIVVSSFDPSQTNEQAGVVADRKWSVADFASKLSLIRAGLGYGYMPDYLVSADLQRGTLREIRCMKRVPTPMFAYRHEDDTDGVVRRSFWRGLAKVQTK